MTSQGTGQGEWFISFDGEKSGPITLRQLVSEVASGDIDDRDFVWREGMTDWEPLTEVEEILRALDAEGIPLPRPGDEYYEEEHSAALRAVLPVGRTGLSILAGYLGLISLLLPPTAILAIPVSIVAIVHLKRNPKKHGMGRAVFGVVGGVLGILIGIAIVITMG